MARRASSNDHIFPFEPSCPLILTMPGNARSLEKGSSKLLTIPRFQRHVCSGEFPRVAAQKIEIHYLGQKYNSS